MGCDIHLFVEKKVEGEWRPVKGPNPYLGFTKNKTAETVLKDWAYTGRDYDLFATLANVRNYARGIKPISNPKGLPENLSEVVRSEADKWECDAHSHSYFTLAELKKAKAKIKSEEFLDVTMKHLENLSQGEDNNVRIVFWFDN